MDEPTPRELERLITRNHAETTSDFQEIKAQHASNMSTLLAQLNAYVLTKVYEADERARAAVQSALDDRLRRVEEEQTNQRKRSEEEQIANRRSNRTAIVMGFSGVVTGVAVVVITMLIEG